MKVIYAKLAYVRECEYFRIIKFKTGKNAVIVKLDEPLQCFLNMINKVGVFQL